jgi:hypothetical protein
LDYCLVEIFTKADYLNLQVEFPDIKSRLKVGLRHFMNRKIDKIKNLLENVFLFRDFTPEELHDFIKNHFEDLFIDPDVLIHRPKSHSTNFYIILLGSVKLYPNTAQTRAFMKKFMEKKGDDEEEDEYEFENVNLKTGDITCLDDRIALNRIDFEDAHRSALLSELDTLTVSDSFGCLDFGEEMREYVTNYNYYISASACELGIITSHVKLKITFKLRIKEK